MNKNLEILLTFVSGLVIVEEKGKGKLWKYVGKYGFLSYFRY